MSNNNSNLKTNTVSLQELLNVVNNLPEAGSGGIDTNDATATAADILEGETAYIKGKKVTGTFTIDEELTTQTALLSDQDAKLAELAEILSNKAAATGEDVTAETNEYTEKIAQLTTAVTALETELAGKVSGGSDNIATSVVIITTRKDSPQLGAGEGTIYYTSSNGKWVEENISLASNDPVTINMATNTVFVTGATVKSSFCQVDGGQTLSTLGNFTCVITDPTATIYLA